MEKKVLSSRMYLYDCAVILMTAQVMLDKITYINDYGIGKVFTFVSIILFVITIISENTFTIGQVIMIGIIGMLSLYAGLQMRQYYFITTIILAIASVNKDIKRTILLMHDVKLVFTAVSVCWYIIFQMRYLFGAHSFGFSHPNFFGIMLTWMILERLYLSFFDIKFIHIVLVCLSGIVIYLFTACDTALIILLITGLLLLMIRYLNIEKFICFISKYIFGVLAILNFILVYTYANGGKSIEIIKTLDELLTGRIREVAQIYSLYGGVTVFGNSVKLGATVPYDTYYQMSYTICDGLYSYLLVCLGIVTTVIIFIVIYFTARKNNIRDALFIILFSLYAIMEVHGLNVYMVFILLVFIKEFIYFFGKGQEENQNDIERKEAVTHVGTHQNTTGRINL